MRVAPVHQIEAYRASGQRERPAQRLVVAVVEAEGDRGHLNLYIRRCGSRMSLMPETVRVHVSTDAFTVALSRFTELFGRLHKIVQQPLGVAQLAPETLGIVVRDDAASTAGDIRTCLQPSDRLLRLVAALETLERDLVIPEVLRHAG